MLSIISVSNETKVVNAMADGIPKQKLQLISSTFLFQNVDRIVVERMVADTRCLRERFPKGARIFDETHFRRCLGILLAGEVRVDKQTPEGKYMKMSRLGPGECFGAAAMFSQRERYATILTTEKSTEVLFLPEELIRWAMHRDFTITENYIRYLSDRIWFLNAKISGLTAGSAEQRLAIFLAEHCGETGQVSTSMTELSRQLNVGRASLYRAMEALEQRGVIRQDGKCLTVIDHEGLRGLTLSK